MTKYSSVQRLKIIAGKINLKRGKASRGVSPRLLQTQIHPSRITQQIRKIGNRRTDCLDACRFGQTVQVRI